MLYWELPWSMVGPQGRSLDAVIQGLDRAIFGTEPARTLALTYPFRPLSELLHLAYLLYYPIIYLPPLVFYRRPGRRGFYQTVFAMTLTVVVAFLAFSVVPVQGPRFTWGAAGAPTGPIRSLTLYILDRGSARWTAFPSSHVAIALAQSLSSLRWSRWFGVAVLATTMILSVGAVYGGFHYGTDVLAGAVLGGVVWMVSRRLEVCGLGGYRG
jgi:membrane-associated phospholipid phosphatase